MSKELEEAVAAIESKIAATVEKYEGQVKDAGSAATEVRAEIKALAEQHKASVEASEDLQARFREVEQRVAGGFRGGAAQEKTWGGNLIDSESFAEFKAGRSGRAKIEVKNTILGEAGSPQEPSNVLVPEQRLPGIVPGAFRSLSILDFVPMGATNSNQIQYTRELAFTNASAETEEGAAKPEATLTFELVDDPVRTIAHWLKVSKQVMDDAPALSSYVDRRLRHGVQQRLQRQVIRGDGSSPNISGLSASGRHTAFVPTSGDNALDSLNRAKYAIIAADYSPNFIMLNPADWGAIERIKRGTADDGYVAGDGAGLAYINNGMTPVVWGLPVIASNDVESGKFYMGDSNAMQLFMRQGATVEMYEQDDKNVQYNLITVRAELRAALAVFTPAAIRYGDLEA